MTLTRQYLVDLLTKAEITAPSANHVAIQPITINLDTRTSIFQHPDSTVVFKNIMLGRHCRLHFSLGIKEIVWDKIKSPIEFQIILTDRKSREHTLFTKSIDARKPGEGRAWQDFSLNLSRFDKQKVTITFITRVPEGGDGSYLWAGWSSPEIECKSSLPPYIKANQNHHNLLLITGDALRSDHLACYGHPQIKTPNLDTLARQGCMFRHARAHTPTTLGSFATMMTSRFATDHKLDREWGKINTSFQNLPSILAENGYTTTAAMSEREHDTYEGGIMSWFSNQLPCLGVPAQSGDITSRKFFNWLDNRPENPFFAWLQFFDTHPPVIPPNSFKSMYYNGDPTSNLFEYRPQDIKMISGVESALEFKRLAMQSGKNPPDKPFIDRLVDCGRSLKNLDIPGPDLKEILLSLGKESMKNLEREEFADWLLKQTDLLKEGVFTKELKDWLDQTHKRLLEVELDVVSWLRNVVDYRYPVSQYMGAISYLDHLVGEVMVRLKERGLYDTTTIVFTSPHGELLGEEGMFFHHLALHENVLRIPAIIKPADCFNCRKGSIIEGVFDQVDWMPTLLEILGLDIPGGLAGASRALEVQTGEAIAEHDSLSIDYHSTLACLARPPYLFIKALDDNFASSQWHWPKGRKALFRLTSPMSYQENNIEDHTAIFSSMENRLDELLVSDMVYANG